MDGRGSQGDVGKRTQGGQNAGDGELVEVGKKATLKRVPIKLSDNGLAKTTGTFAAWVLREKGIAEADAASILNKWWKVGAPFPSCLPRSGADATVPFQLKETYNAIYELSGKDRSGAPYTYSYENGFGELGSMQAEFDSLCDGTAAKGSKNSQLSSVSHGHG
jgi:hypothetical protein